jgi:Nucleotide modification associated domain 2
MEAGVFLQSVRPDFHPIVRMKSPMPRHFTFIIPIDDGAASNPFHEMCTLAIYKPANAVGQNRAQ